MGVLEHMWPIRGIVRGEGDEELALVRFCSQLRKYARSGTVMAPGGPESSLYPSKSATILVGRAILIGAWQRRQWGKGKYNFVQVAPLEVTARKALQSVIAVCTVSAVGGSHNGFAEELVLLGCYTVSLG